MGRRPKAENPATEGGPAHKESLGVKIKDKDLLAKAYARMEALGLIPARYLKALIEADLAHAEENGQAAPISVSLNPESFPASPERLLREMFAIQLYQIFRNLGHPKPKAQHDASLFLDPESNAEILAGLKKVALAENPTPKKSIA